MNCGLLNHENKILYNRQRYDDLIFKIENEKKGNVLIRGTPGQLIIFIKEFQ